MKHEVIVGNIGTVYSGTSYTRAEDCYRLYMLDSLKNYGRASGESVTWFTDGEIRKEYIGTINQEEK